MSHKNHKSKEHANALMEEWDRLSVELEREINLARLEKSHLSLVDRFIEKTLGVEIECQFTNSRLKQYADKAEAMRSRIRRKLFREGTATDIPFDQIRQNMNE